MKSQAPERAIPLRGLGLRPEGLAGLRAAVTLTAAHKGRTMARISHPLRSLLLSALLGCAGAGAPAWAQEAGEDFTPSESELDQDLDQSLADEFAEAPPPERPVVPTPPPPSGGKTDDRLRLRLGGIAAYAWTGFHDLEISHREGNRGGDTVLFEGGDGDQSQSFEFESGSGYYRAWFDIGPWVSLQGAFSHAAFKDTNVLSNTPGGTPGFVFGDTAFQTGDAIQVRYTLRLADFDVAIHPLHLDWLRLDVTLGARYVFWQTRFDSVRSGQNQEKTLEALIPMIGLGISFRPVSPMELFLRGRIGALELEREEGRYRRRDGQTRRIEPFKREQSSLELDGGVAFTIDDTIGVVLGARINYLEIERQTEREQTRFEGTASSLYAGLIVNF